MPRKLIVLIEDDADQVLLFQRALRTSSTPVEVTVVGDGQAAFEFLHDAAEPPTVVLLDLDLPRLPGLEVLKWIRSQEHTRLIPVVILSSSDRQADLANSYALGANGYVCKPANFQEYQRTVQATVHYWTAINVAM
jgi:two-component system, response regulator